MTQSKRGMLLHPNKFSDKHSSIVSALQNIISPSRAAMVQSGLVPGSARRSARTCQQLQRNRTQLETRILLLEQGIDSKATPRWLVCLRGLLAKTSHAIQKRVCTSFNEPSVCYKGGVTAEYYCSCCMGKPMFSLSAKCGRFCCTIEFNKFKSDHGHRQMNECDYLVLQKFDIQYVS